MKVIENLVIMGKAGDVEAKEELVIRLHPLVLASIKRYYFGDMDFDDLVQEGRLRILLEIDKFQEDRGVPFLGYIKLKIKYLYMELRIKKRELLTLNLLIEEGIELVDMLEGDEDIEKTIINLEASQELKEALNNLSLGQQRVISMIYIEGMTMKKASRILGLHYQSVVALKKRGLEKLRKQLRIKS